MRTIIKVTCSSINKKPSRIFPFVLLFLSLFASLPTMADFPDYIGIPTKLKISKKHLSNKARILIQHMLVDCITKDTIEYYDALQYTGSKYKDNRKSKTGKPLVLGNASIVQEDKYINENEDFDLDTVLFIKKKIHKNYIKYLLRYHIDDIRKKGKYETVIDTSYVLFTTLTKKPYRLISPISMFAEMDINDYYEKPVTTLSDIAMMSNNELYHNYYRNKKELKEGRITLSRDDYYRLYNIFTEQKKTKEQDTLTIIAYNQIVKQKDYEKDLFNMFICNRMALQELRSGNATPNTLEPFIREGGHFNVKTSDGKYYNYKEITHNYILTLVQSDKSIGWSCCYNSDPMYFYPENYVHSKHYFYTDTIMYCAPENEAIKYIYSDSEKDNNYEENIKRLQKIDNQDARKWYLWGMLETKKSTKNKVFDKERKMLANALFHHCFSMNPRLKEVYDNDGLLYDERIDFLPYQETDSAKYIDLFEKYYSYSDIKTEPLQNVADTEQNFLFSLDTSPKTAIRAAKTKEPAFPGGEECFMEYIKRSTKYPAIAEENGIEGKVIWTFTVNYDGSIKDVRLLKSVDASLDREALRVIKSMPMWIPAKENGKTVKRRYKLSTNFRLLYNEEGQLREKFESKDFCLTALKPIRLSPTVIFQDGLVYKLDTQRNEATVIAACDTIYKKNGTYRYLQSTKTDYLIPDTIDISRDKRYPVRKIAKGAFFNCQFLKRVDTPLSINIEDSAFAFCPKLKDISLSEEIKNIDTFIGCDSLLMSHNVSSHDNKRLNINHEVVETKSGMNIPCHLEKIEYKDGKPHLLKILTTGGIFNMDINNVKCISYSNGHTDTF